jgi:shikimate dehydrogenase
MITGSTRLIAHLGVPTATFKAPMIYNPYFAAAGIDAVVVPMGCQAADYASFLKLLFKLTNIHGALVTMPHKVTTLALVDTVSTAAKIAGACNAIRLMHDGTLAGDMFDGEGFVRGVARKGLALAGASAMVVGSGGVGSAIAASLAGARVARLAIDDTNRSAAGALAARLRLHYPALQVSEGMDDPAAFDLIVNATPLGMQADDALPFDVSRLGPKNFVGEVVLKREMTPLLQAAAARGCRIQVGLDMLFEQIPAYLEFFGFPTTTPERLRALANIVET